jgi:hypothetical protein
MAEYRIYPIDADSLHKASPVVVHAEADAQARSRATELAEKHAGAEVWQGTHFVCRTPAQRTQRGGH